MIKKKNIFNYTVYFENCTVEKNCTFFFVQKIFGHPVDRWLIIYPFSLFMNALVKDYFSSNKIA